MYEQATATSSSINLEKRMINLLIIVLRAVVAVAKRADCSSGTDSPVHRLMTAET